jgi:hypothetical protein
MTNRIREFSADAPGLAAALDEDGMAVVAGVFTGASCRAIAAELQPHLKCAKSTDAATLHATGLIAKSPSFRALVTHPAPLAACDAVLKPNCAHYQLHATRAFVIGPGAPRQALHRETDAFEFFRRPRPELVVSAMLAVTDFTADNGATLLVPGSHRWPLDRRPRPEEAVAGQMKAGSLLLWVGDALHGAGANVSAERRFGAFLSYSLGWLRQEENQYLGVPPELALALPRELRRIVGYRLHHPALGYADADAELIGD